MVIVKKKFNIINARPRFYNYLFLGILIKMQNFLQPWIYNKGYKLFLLIITSLSLQPCYPSFENLTVGARPLALGGAFVGLADNSDAIFINPAGIGRIETINISGFYARPYGLKELAHRTLGMVYPNRYFSFGAAIQAYGYNLYNETSFTLALSRGYLKKIYYGLSIRYMRLRIKGYGSAGCFGLDAGILLKPDSNLSIGVFSGNLSRSTIGRDKEKLPQIYSTGLYYQPFHQIGLTLDVYKDVSFPIEYRYGIEYKALQYIDIRVGIANNPARFSAGFGLHLKRLCFDYAIYTHRDLGLSHQFSISFSPGKYRTFLKDEILPLKTEKMTSKGKKIPKKKIEKLKSGSGITININTAEKVTLQRIPHVGKKLAQAIIDYRNKYGPFQELIEIEKVPGIGIKLYEKIKEFIRLKD